MKCIIGVSEEENQNKGRIYLLKTKFSKNVLKKKRLGTWASLVA